MNARRLVTGIMVCVTLTGLVALAAPPAEAWDSKGHGLVGLVAKESLDPDAEVASTISEVAMTASDPTTAAKPTVLVVDDDPEIRTLLVDVLTDDGYAVRTAVDGVAAVKCFVEDRPDLILLDVDMPRLRGIETLLVIRELSPETRVIMISGKADESEARRALALGAFDYISKPFDLAYLHHVIEAAV